jgi:hypothetical protein
MVELGWVLSQCGQRRCNVEYCVLVLLGAIMNHELMAAMRRSLVEKFRKIRTALIIAVRYFERERKERERKKGSIFFGFG